jgi:hypothetical protein
LTGVKRGGLKRTPDIYRLRKMKVLAVVGACAGITIALGMVSIWLGIVALPVMYEVAESLLSD